MAYVPCIIQKEGQCLCPVHGPSTHWRSQRASLAHVRLWLWLLLHPHPRCYRLCFLISRKPDTETASKIFWSAHFTWVIQRTLTMTYHFTFAVNFLKLLLYQNSKVTQPCLQGCKQRQASQAWRAEPWLFMPSSDIIIHDINDNIV